MKNIKTFEEFLFESNNLILFRGQSGDFYKEEKLGYIKYYDMLFLTPDINSAYYYSLRGNEKVREISVFEVPDNIKHIQGSYIDRDKKQVDKAKEEGYDGITSNVAEFIADKGEVGLFDIYKPIKRFQTITGSFTDKQLNEMKKYGLSQNNINNDKNIKNRKL